MLSWPRKLIADEPRHAYCWINLQHLVCTERGCVENSIGSSSDAAATAWCVKYENNDADVGLTCECDQCVDGYEPKSDYNADGTADGHKSLGGSEQVP